MKLRMHYLGNFLLRLKHVSDVTGQEEKGSHDLETRINSIMTWS